MSGKKGNKEKNTSNSVEGEVQNFKKLREHAEVAVEKIDQIKKETNTLTADLVNSSSEIRGMLNELLVENPRDEYSSKNPEIQRKLKAVNKKLGNVLTMAVEFLVLLKNKSINVTIPAQLQEYIRKSVESSDVPTPIEPTPAVPVESVSPPVVPEPAKEPEPVVPKPESEKPVETPPVLPTEVEKEKKEVEKKKGIIDLSASDLKEIVGEKHIREIREVKVLLAHSGNEIQAREILETLFDNVDKDILEKKIAKSGYTVNEFLHLWKEEWSGKLIDVFKGDVQFERTKVMEAQKGTLGGIKDWFKANTSLARAKQILARVGSVAGVAVAVGYAAPIVGLGGAAGVIGGGAAGAATWSQKKVKKFSEWFKKADEAAAERTHEKQEEIIEHRLHSEEVSEALYARLKQESEVELFGMLSGVIRETSFEVASTKPVEDGRHKMEFANQALLQQHCYERMVAEMETTGAEEKEVTGKRMDAVIMGLYADESKHFSNVLASAIAREPALLNVIRKINAFKNVDFDALLHGKEDHGHGHDDGHGKKGHKEDHGKGHGKGHGSDHGHGGHGHGSGIDREKVLKLLNFAGHAAVGAGIAAAIQEKPGLISAVTKGLTFGYLGMKIGVGIEQKAREKNFEKKITALITDAEHVLTHTEDGMKLGEVSKEKPLTKETSLEYRTWAQEIRMALNFGLIKKNTTIWYRAHTVLRGIESRVYELSLPDTKMRNLLAGLEADRELQKHEQEEKLAEFGKVGKAPMIIGGIVGATVGAIGGYMWGSARAHGHNTPAPNHHLSQEAGAAGVSGVVVGSEPYVPQGDLPHGSTGFDHSPVTTPEPTGMQATQNTLDTHANTVEHPTETLLRTSNQVERLGDTHSIVEVIHKGEGVLSGANRAVDKALESHSIPALDALKDGGKLHAWKIKELENMGFIFKDGKWGYPFTVHPGAQVELYTDENGNPHFKMASEEHVTMNKFYQFKEAGVSDARVSPDLQKEISGARANVQKFVGEINESTQMNSTTQPSIIIDKDLSAEIRVGGQIPGVLHAETAYDGTAVKLTLEGGRTAYAYPAQGADLKLGTNANNDKFYWKIQTVEHSPIFQLPDEVSAGKTGGMIDSDIPVKKSEVVVNREIYEKTKVASEKIEGVQTGKNKLQTSEKPLEKVNTPQAPTQKSPEKIIAPENALDIIKTRTEIQQEFARVKATVSHHIDVLETTQSISRADIRADHMGKLREIEELVKNNSFDGRTSKEFASLVNQEIKQWPAVDQLLARNTFEYQSVNFGGAEGNVNISNAVTEDGIQTSWLMIETKIGNQNVEHIFNAPEGYTFTIQDNAVKLVDAQGNIQDIQLSENNLSQALILPPSAEKGVKTPVN